MSETDWELEAEETWLLRIKIKSMESSLQTLTLAVQDMSAALAECQRRIKALEEYLARNEKGAGK